MLLSNWTWANALDVRQLVDVRLGHQRTFRNAHAIASLYPRAAKIIRSRGIVMYRICCQEDGFDSAIHSIAWGLQTPERCAFIVP